MDLITDAWSNLSYSILVKGASVYAARLVGEKGKNRSEYDVMNNVYMIYTN